jgi:hypothetical protein
MLKEKLILRNPLRMIGFDQDDILSRGEFGAVLSRAGVGKTSMLVQIAITPLLRGENILHVSLRDQVDKVALWYEEVFHKLVDPYKNMPAAEIRQLWEDILSHRFIMTLNEDDFSVSKLEDKLSELRKQNIFLPKMLIVDGLPFEDRNDMFAWFSVRTHRHEEPGIDGFPIQLEGLVDMFKVILQLQPEGKDIHVKTLKGATEGQTYQSLLDPATLLIQHR